MRFKHAVFAGVSFETIADVFGGSRVFVLVGIPTSKKEKSGAEFACRRNYRIFNYSNT